MYLDTEEYKWLLLEDNNEKTLAFLLTTFFHILSNEMSFKNILI